MVEENLNFNKKMHMFGVAQFMHDQAPKYGLKPDEMYVLGLLHDVGYIYDGWHNHEEKGANLMRELGFKYADAISLHGVDVDDFNGKTLSKEAMLLMAADSCVDYEGNIGSYESRRKDIEKRYDERDKSFYLERFDKRIKFLKENGFNY